MVAIEDHGGHARRRRATPRLGRVVSALFGAALAAYGAANVDTLPWGEAATAIAAQAWPVAQASVETAAIHEIAVPTANGVQIGLSLSLAYTFEVDGRTVHATTASLNDQGAAYDRRLVALYRRAAFSRITGRTLPVAYDPDEPSRAYLQVSVPWGRLLPGLGLGLAAFLMAGWFFSRAFPRPPERRLRP